MAEKIMGVKCAMVEWVKRNTLEMVKSYKDDVGGQNDTACVEVM